MAKAGQGGSPSLVHLIAAVASLRHVLFLRGLLAGDAMYYHAQFFLPLLLYLYLGFLLWF